MRRWHFDRCPRNPNVLQIGLNDRAQQSAVMANRRRQQRTAQPQENSPLASEEP